MDVSIIDLRYFAMGEYAERIKEAAKPFGGVPGLAAEMGRPAQTVYNWIRTPAEPKASDIVALAEASKRSVHWWLYGIEAQEKTLELAIAERAEAEIALRRLDLRASAGAGSLVEAVQQQTPLTVPRDWLAKFNVQPTAVIVAECGGDSMMPTLDDGDLLLVDTSITDELYIRERGGIYIIVHEGAFQVKRLQGIPSGGIRIISDNDNYPSIDLDRDRAATDLVVQGRVFWSGGAIRKRM